MARDKSDVINIINNTWNIIINKVPTHSSQDFISYVKNIFPDPYYSRPI